MFEFQRPELHRPPALTTGLPIFLVFFQLASYYFNTKESLAIGGEYLLHPSFDLLNRLSFFAVIHLNWIYLLLNIIALTPLLAEFELANGTVRTGILLNVLSVLPGLLYCAITAVCGIDVKVMGASSWVFAFLGYSGWVRYLAMPNLPLRLPIQIPTWSFPIAILLISSLLFPYASFLGHAIWLGFGYLLGMGYLGFSYNGTTKAVRAIESRIQPVINFLAYIVVWTQEDDLRPLADEGHVLGV